MSESKQPNERVSETISADGKTRTVSLDGKVVSINTVLDPVHVVISGKGDYKLPKTK